MAKWRQQCAVSGGARRVRCAPQYRLESGSRRAPFCASFSKEISALRKSQSGQNTAHRRPADLGAGARSRLWLHQHDRVFESPRHAGSPTVSGRPSCLPLNCACTRPARVRSRRISLSNSARWPAARPWRGRQALSGPVLRYGPDHIPKEGESVGFDGRRIRERERERERERRNERRDDSVPGVWPADE